MEVLVQSILSASDWWKLSDTDHMGNSSQSGIILITELLQLFQNHYPQISEMWDPSYTDEDFNNKAPASHTETFSLSSICIFIICVDLFGSKGRGKHK